MHLAMQQNIVPVLARNRISLIARPTERKCVVLPTQPEIGQLLSIIVALCILVAIATRHINEAK